MCNVITIIINQVMLPSDQLISIYWSVCVPNCSTLHWWGNMPASDKNKSAKLLPHKCRSLRGSGSADRTPWSVEHVPVPRNVLPPLSRLDLSGVSRHIHKGGGHISGLFGGCQEVVDARKLWRATHAFTIFTAFLG